MKRIFIKIRIFIGLFLFASMTTFAQNGMYDVRFQTAYDGCNAFVVIQIKANNAGATFKVASQNYRFEYNNLVLSNPQLEAELGLSGFVVDENQMSSFYEPHSLSGSLGNVISYSVPMISGNGYFLNETNWLSVGRIKFDVLTEDNPSDLVWNDSNTFPSTTIQEKIGDQIYGATEGEYNDKNGWTFAPVALEKTEQNEHVCLSDLDQVYYYEVKNATDAIWEISPANAAEFVAQPWNGSGLAFNKGEKVFVRFLDASIQNVEIKALRPTSCENEFTWDVKLNSDGVWPGDVNHDGEVDWASDASAYLFAKSVLDLQKMVDPNFETNPRPSDISGYDDGAYSVPVDPSTSYDWGCQYGEDWIQPNGNPLDISYDGGAAVNLKHADINGDGNLELGTEGYYPANETLNSISTGAKDLDVIAKYDWDAIAPYSGSGGSSSGSGGSLNLIHLDSVLVPDLDELRLVVTLGTEENPIENVHSIAFETKFKFGTYLNPRVDYSESHLGSSAELNTGDFPAFETTNDEDPSYYVALGRHDLSGKSFGDEIVNSLFCDFPVAGIEHIDEEEMEILLEDDSKNNVIIDTLEIEITRAVVRTTSGGTLAIKGSKVEVPYRHVVLPLELISFEAFAKREDAKLRWETANEVAFAGFEIERSFDGVTFEKIAWVASTTLEGEGAQYEYVDENVQSDAYVYYRLNMLDLDGTSIHSKIREVKFGQNDFSSVSIQPNPVKGEFELSFETNLADPATIQIVNTLGQVVFQQNEKIQEGFNRIAIDAASLSAGMYMVEVRQGPYRFTRKFVKQ